MGIGEDVGVDRNGELEARSEEEGGTGELDRTGKRDRVTMVGGNEGRSMVRVSDRDEGLSKTGGEGVHKRVEGWSMVGVGEGLSNALRRNAEKGTG